MIDHDNIGSRAITAPSIPIAVLVVLVMGLVVVESTATESTTTTVMPASVYHDYDLLCFFFYTSFETVHHLRHRQQSQS
jgi:hypothetical protein